LRAIAAVALGRSGLGEFGGAKPTIGIDADANMDLAAKHLLHRHAEHLAPYVPQGLSDGVDRGECNPSCALRPKRMVLHFRPQLLDPVGIAANTEALAKILAHTGRRRASKAVGIILQPSLFTPRAAELTCKRRPNRLCA
jgi:hypothetical protein